MSKQIEALKMAIEWMKDEPNLDYQFYLDTMEACKEALAEAEKQEPVAWMFVDTDGNIYFNLYKCLDEGKNIPLYAKDNLDEQAD